METFSSQLIKDGNQFWLSFQSEFTVYLSVFAAAVNMACV